jgi:acyl-CoA synthetase (AMP-forming)/AMP-acid ligase II
MSFLLLLVAYLFMTPIRAFLLSLFFPKKEKKHEEISTEQLAEIDGGVWERLSVLEHIDQGLKKNPDGPAVICMFQPANCLEDLITGDQKVQRPNALWQQQLHNGTVGQPNGFLELQNNGHQSGVRWGKQQNGLAIAIKQENISQNATHNPTCLTLSYTQLHRTALKLAAGVLANGAQANTTMLMLIPNGGEYALLLWTCILLRITYVSLDPASLDISGFTALKHTLQTLKPQLVVAPDALSGKAVDVAVSELQLPQPIRLCLSPSRTRGWKSLADVAVDAAKCPIDEAALVATARHDSPERIHSILFTSGTSGRPKGCPLRVAGMSHVLHSQSWLVDSEAGAFALQQGHNSRGIAPAQTLQTWRAGGAVVMTGQGFSVAAAAEAIRQFGMTFIVLTPPMVHEMAAELAARPLDVSSVKKIQIGGDAVTKGLLTKCAALFPQARVCVNHGMTEGGGSFVWPFFETPASNIPFFGEICPIGAVAPGSVVRIWDTERKCVVGKGELGELHISCGSIIRHYLGGRSEESFYDDRKGRWFNTGDIAMADSDGVVFILGRKKDMIKRAGVALMPAAIESSIEAFTGAQVSRVAPFKFNQFD